MKITPSQIALFVALLISNAIIFFAPPAWAWLRVPNSVVFVLALPGLAWLPVLNWLHTRQAIERLVLVFGASSLLAALLLYGVVLLPGPFTELPVLLALNGLTVAGLAVQLFKRDGWRGPLEWPSRTVLLILLAIVAVTAVTRLARLNYAEFHEDELENMRLIIRAYKGEEFAPFIDSKGPIHWLLPAALWFANGWGNEGLARSTFALASLLLVPLMFALARRMTGKDYLGLAAAGFIALNGFYVALARHVENRMLIVFWGALAMWLAYRYFKEKVNLLALAAALTLGVGLIAHPTVITFVPAVAVVLLARSWLDKSWRQDWPWLAGSALLLAAVTAAFYVPYLLNPEIGQTVEYFAEERVGTALLYNRIDSLLGESELYSSWFYGPLLLALLAWLLGREFSKIGRAGLIIFGLLALAVISTSRFPAGWVWGSENFAFVPSALLALAVLLLPRTSPELKFNVVWFAVPAGVLLFLARDASNHIQIAFTGLTMLAVIGLGDLWNWLTPAPGARLFSPRRSGRAALAAVAVLVAPLIVGYEFLQFNALTTTYWQVKTDYTDNPRSLYALLYRSIPRPRKVISNPRLGGWKPVGVLWADGSLSGDFRSVNESFAVPIWYTFQTPRSCYTDPQNYWVRRDWEGWPQEEENLLLANGYTLTRVVQIDGRPSLHLYEKNAPAAEPQVLNMEDYRRQFDLLATPGRFALAETLSRPASLNFGDKLLLRGFDLPDTGRAGELLPVTLYWDALAPMDVRYRAFVHLVGADDSRWGQHDDDPGCRLVTTDMHPGMGASRQFRVPVAADTPPGDYQIVVGMYHPETQARLPIWDNTAQNSPGDSVILGTVRIIDGS